MSGANWGKRPASDSPPDNNSTASPGNIHSHKRIDVGSSKEGKIDERYQQLGEKYTDQTFGEIAPGSSSSNQQLDVLLELRSEFKLPPPNFPIYQQSDTPLKSRSELDLPSLYCPTYTQESSEFLSLVLQPELDHESLPGSPQRGSVRATFARSADDSQNIQSKTLVPSSDIVAGPSAPRPDVPEAVHQHLKSISVARSRTAG